MKPVVMKMSKRRSEISKILQSALIGDFFDVEKTLDKIEAIVDEDYEQEVKYNEELTRQNTRLQQENKVVWQKLEEMSKELDIYKKIVLHIESAGQSAANAILTHLGR